MPNTKRKRGTMMMVTGEKPVSASAAERRRQDLAARRAAWKRCLERTARSRAELDAAIAAADMSGLEGIAVVTGARALGTPKPPGRKPKTAPLGASAIPDSDFMERMAAPAPPPKPRGRAARTSVRKPTPKAQASTGSARGSRPRDNVDQPISAQRSKLWDSGAKLGPEEQALGQVVRSSARGSRPRGQLDNASASKLSPEEQAPGPSSDLSPEEQALALPQGAQPGGAGSGDAVRIF